MNKILISIDNGQRKQALRMLSEKGYSLAELAYALIGTNNASEVVTMLRIAENTGFIEVHPEAVKE